MRGEWFSWSAMNDSFMVYFLVSEVQRIAHLAVLDHLERPWKTRRVIESGE